MALEAGTPTRAPFAERGGSVRGVLDLVAGCYPAFLFGGRVGQRLLPVFHLHEATVAALEPQLRYLAENGYRTVTSDAIARFVRDGVHPGPHAVAICFDDAWSSLWMVAFPLLKRYGLTAITFAIPGRIRDADDVRPTLDEGLADADGTDASESPFVTWPELRAMHASGVVDVQSHTYSHSPVFCADAIAGFVTPDYDPGNFLNRPLLDGEPAPTYLSRKHLGAPIHPSRSRMADVRRVHEDRALRARCMEHVDAHGGAAFFGRERWHAELRAVAAAAPASTRVESEAERARALEDELARSRDVLNDRLGAPVVRQVCFPWGIAGELARETARRVGYETAFADRLFGRRVVSKGDDPYSLMRLHDRFISCLPGRGRKFFFSVA